MEPLHVEQTLQTVLEVSELSVSIERMDWPTMLPSFKGLLQVSSCFRQDANQHTLLDKVLRLARLVAVQLGQTQMILREALEQNKHEPQQLTPKPYTAPSAFLLFMSTSQLARFLITNDKFWLSLTVSEAYRLQMKEKKFLNWECPALMLQVMSNTATVCMLSIYILFPSHVFCFSNI